jgi:hypothetical protein
MYYLFNSLEEYGISFTPNLWQIDPQRRPKKATASVPLRVEGQVVVVVVVVGCVIACSVPYIRYK